MAKDTDQSVAVKDTVYKLQLSLLEGIQNDDQLFAAGSIMSRSDYEDVVTERSIANLCGYPLCRNYLPVDRPRKGRYRVSLKEHKVYDLHETYMYCSSSCVVNSHTFAGSLQDERTSVLNPAKLNEVLRLFENLRLDSEGLGKHEDLGFSNLTIQEKTDSKAAEVSWEESIGPSNAIEGYVPRSDRIGKPSTSKKQEGKKASNKDFLINDMDFMSTIITQDEYSISKAPSGLAGTASDMKTQKEKGKGIQKDLKAQSSAVKKHDSGKTSRKLIQEKSKMVIKDAEAEEKSQADKASIMEEAMLKPSLKPFGAKKLSRSVTWADEKVDSAGSRSLCEIREMDNSRLGLESSDKMVVGDDGNMLRFESAEACAIALSQAAEAVASGDTGATDAISEAGVIILPRPQDVDHGDSLEDADMVEQEPAPLEWPTKPGIPESEYFDPDDLWYDVPPEGFSLTLSPFATTWMALFAWMTSSSLAYIYGRHESSREDYSSVNGREYPQKIVLGDGRSTEIKRTIEGCLGRACPGLVTDLRLPIPISTIEQGMACLLDTMSFADAVPAFRMKQWQVIALLFLEALSVCRIPTLAPHMTIRRVVLHKVLDGAQITEEEYELMKDLIIPLGRIPDFSAQSGA